MLHFHAVARMFWLVARGLLWLLKCSEWVLACFYVVTVFNVVARVLLSVASFSGS